MLLLALVADTISKLYSIIFITLYFIIDIMNRNSIYIYICIYIYIYVNI